MSFTMAGTRGAIRHRTTPKGYGQGSRGVVDKHGRNKTRKQKLDAERSFDFAKTQDSKPNVFKRALGKVTSVFARGNR